MADFEVYLNPLPNGRWQVIGHRDRGNQRQGAALIIQSDSVDVLAALRGQTNLPALPDFYQNRLKGKGFVGITLSELIRLTA